MQYITFTADTYEEAVAKARKEYGDRIRIHSRRDYTVGGGLFAKKRNRSEITCYLTDSKPVEEVKETVVSNKELEEFEKEAKTPNPETLTKEEIFETDLTKVEEVVEEEVNSDENYKKAVELLEENNIRGAYKDFLLSSPFITDDVYLELSDRILSSVELDHKNQAHPKKFVVFLGPTGSGKTTTLAKIAHLYKTISQKRVAILTLDSYRIGAYEQIKAYSDAFGIPVELIDGEDDVLLKIEQFNDYDLVLVDTMGISPKDGALNLKLKGMLNLLPKNETMHLFVCAANIKRDDILKQYKNYSSYGFTSMIVTKMDETESVGSILTFSYETKLPLLFFANGQKVPEDLKKASTTVVLEYLKGFGYNVQHLAQQLTSN